ncbi:MAG: hypothetical protein ABS41_04540 [Arenimonas sp. SCN 70-307]|uniref:DUF3667 domain-containing protein n=1 Tax=Arenimonas sp. SCN 70-307 TaxID=1660089 RepID=UPI00086B7215|nr:DUF3667 domain-containing protein [Arenimonas sp. SCN 70-307]ODS63917.1 MAG: hypothetical protein ABS41_04540 [Arenimonas sp. SCN 70-307]
MSDTATPPAAPETEARRCQNCGELLLGEHCYACGQPTKGLVRHFGSIIGDFMDSVFELDSRILRTLGPLMFRPGFLSTEYFAGRRVRYVSPVRLFVFLSLFAFFAAQLSFNFDEDDDGEAPKVQVGTEQMREDRSTGGIRRATSVAEVERLRDEALEALKEARGQTTDIPGVDFGVGVGLDVAEKSIAAEAARRIREIEQATAEGREVPVPPELPTDGSMSFNGRPWHPVDNPLHIGWIGEGGNAWLNRQAGKANENAKRIQGDPNLLKDAFLSTVPTSLFVLLPLFAAFLKLMYVFKRRLYMEHLIVALHSHAFLCAALLVVLALDALAAWTAGLPWLSRPIGWVEVAMICWMPAYLLLMQKRVYGQGWIMTLLKYWVLGTAYLFLISLGATLNLLVSLVNM